MRAVGTVGEGRSWWQTVGGEQTRAGTDEHRLGPMKVARRLRPLAGDDVERFPEPCRRCLFWELGGPRPREAEAGTDNGEAVTRKQAWCAARGLQDAPPGRVARVGEEVGGYVLFAPPGSFARRLPTVPAPSGDALMVATLWVEPRLRGHGVGRLLLQAAIREASRRELDAVEVYGDWQFREGGCVLPATWLIHEGFQVRRAHPRYPLLRVELSRTARWTESLEQALEELLDHVPGRAAPAPGAVLSAEADGPG